jgi:hypothetical protein
MNRRRSHNSTDWCGSHSRQSTRLFLQLSELGPPTPHPPTSRRVRPPTLVPGGDTVEGVRGVPVRTRGQTLWYSRYIYMYFVGWRKGGGSCGSVIGHSMCLETFTYICHRLLYHILLFEAFSLTLIYPKDKKIWGGLTFC